jgi:DNA-directed RNA polymerase subunit RPC12/RpoP
MANYYCRFCGSRFANVSSLTSSTCPRHPLGGHKGKHELYEGSEKSRYTCKYCGYTAASISSLTSMTCVRHPDGAHKGKHSPAL